MSEMVSNRSIGEALSKRGLIPTRCRLIDVHMEPTGALTVRYEKYIGDELALFADALREVAEAMKP